METFKRGEHLIFKEDNLEIVFTHHFQNRFIDRNGNIDTKKLLKILKIVNNIYNKFSNGYYDIENSNNESIKVHIYKDNKYNIDKIDILSFIDKNEYNFTKDKKIYSNF